MLLASCTTKTTSSTTTTTTANKTTTTTKTTTTSTTTNPITTTSTTTTSVTGNWWDSLGTPKYGGTLIVESPRDITDFDPYNLGSNETFMAGWMETLWADDWLTDPSVFAHQLMFKPAQFMQGQLAESWEFTAPGVLTVHLKHGIKWQNIPPANGREFVASDVVYHFDREYGLGGFPMDPYLSTDVMIGLLKDVTSPETYTVVFQCKTNNPEAIMETLVAYSSPAHFENPEAVKQWGDLNDWHHAIGTGPFILTDFVSSSSMTMVKNPNYWGHDERYPANPLPYVDGIKVLIMPDTSTALAAMRSGKIDIMDGNSLQVAQNMSQTNPKILQIPVPWLRAFTVDPRNDIKPFSDINVRKAMQLAMNLPELAQDYYQGTCSPDPSTLTSNAMTGWGFPYDQWPQELKDQYKYDPAQAKQLLAAAGYPTINTDVVADSSADLSLLQIVQGWFADVGITMAIRTMDTASWVNFVQAGHKQDGLAYNPSGGLGLTHEPNRQILRYTTNYVVNWAMVSDPNYDAFYKQAQAVTNIDDFKQIVKDANQYIAEHHFVISLLQPKSFNFCQPWVKAYNGQFDAFSGGTSGPQQLFEYGARVWIDPTLK